MNQTNRSIVRVAVAAILGSFAVCSTAPAAMAVPQTGQAAPNFSMGVVANGHGTFTLSKLKGRAVYLNFFASWCVPCKAELPSIARLAKKYAKKGVTVIGVDELESSEVTLKFTQQFKLPYEIGIDDSGSIGASYGLIGMPLHVFIGADGKVVSRRSGQMSEDQIRAGLDQIASK
jgi:thiol-disulfide isomerase/thioredoxin